MRDRPRSCEVVRDRPNSSEIVRDRPSSSEIVRDRARWRPPDTPLRRAERAGRASPRRASTARRAGWTRRTLRTGRERARGGECRAAGERGWRGVVLVHAPRLGQRLGDALADRPDRGGLVCRRGDGAYLGRLSEGSSNPPGEGGEVCRRGGRRRRRRRPRPSPTRGTAPASRSRASRWSRRARQPCSGGTPCRAGRGTLETRRPATAQGRLRARPRRAGRGGALVVARDELERLAVEELDCREHLQEGCRHGRGGRGPGAAEGLDGRQHLAQVALGGGEGLQHRLSPQISPDLPGSPREEKVCSPASKDSHPR